jgi:hypothetical protein
MFGTVVTMRRLAQIDGVFAATWSVYPHMNDVYACAAEMCVETNRCTAVSPRTQRPAIHPCVAFRADAFSSLKQCALSQLC